MLTSQHKLVIVVILFGLCADYSVALRNAKRRNRTGQRSPLDEEGLHEDRQADFAGGLLPLNPEAMIPDKVALDRLPECQHACNTAFHNAMRVALQAGNHHERFLGVCRHFNESLACHDDLVACPGREAFDILTSGLYYMCIEQRNAFDKVIECLDIKSTEVQNVCENKCAGQNRLSEWAAKSGLFNMFSRSENTFRDFEPENFRVLVHDVCDLANCYLTCIRTTYNEKCGDNAGTLLSEAIVRPVAETQSEPFIKSMTTVMYVLVPQQCSLFVREDVLASHRIDPQVDMELKQRAEEEIRKNQTAIVENMNQQQIVQSQQPEPKTANVPPRPESRIQPDTDQEELVQSLAQFQNNTAIVGDMSDFDPIDLNEKWGLDIGHDY